ncbi:hypothetical protein SAMN05421858_3347 [Haladaptatus litoreus]|uniref:Uncharacterized protein n=1 Tax=Haladaptatus litoreus TaxID=553468 RepID=A0A1N7CYM9_9EURY|nr:hypothetical protein SAMN05421858_3347 [Haladaptatus litoreus]
MNYVPETDGCVGSTPGRSQYIAVTSLTVSAIIAAFADDSVNQQSERRLGTAFEVSRIIYCNC